MSRSFIAADTADAANPPRLAALDARLRGLALCAVLAGPLAACATPRASAFVREASVVALRRDTVPVARLDVGHARGVDVLLDTGSETSIVDDRFARSAELPTRTYLFPRKLRGIGWTRRSSQYALIDGLALGDGARADDVAMQLVDLRNLPVPGRGGDELPPIVLGGNVLEALVTLFDAPRGEVVFVPTGDVRATLRARYPGTRWESLPVDWQDGAPVAVLTAPDGGGIPMLLDTGAELSVIGDEWVQRHGFARDPAAESRLFGSRFEGRPPESAPVRRVDGVRLGTLPLSFPAVRTPGRRGILGNDVLRTFPFVLDGPRGLIAFPVRREVVR